MNFLHKYSFEGLGIFPRTKINRPLNQNYLKDQKIWCLEISKIKYCFKSQAFCVCKTDWFSFIKCIFV